VVADGVVWLQGRLLLEGAGFEAVLDELGWFLGDGVGFGSSFEVGDVFAEDAFVIGDVPESIVHGLGYYETRDLTVYKFLTIILDELHKLTSFGRVASQLDPTQESLTHP